MTSSTRSTCNKAIVADLLFKFEGVLREREYLYGKHVDRAIYSILASELSLNKALLRTSR